MPAHHSCPCQHAQWGSPPPPPPPIAWGPLLRVVGVVLILAITLYGWRLTPMAGRAWADACQSDVVKAQPAHVRTWACPPPTRPRPAKAGR